MFFFLIGQWLKYSVAEQAGRLIRLVPAMTQQAGRPNVFSISPSTAVRNCVSTADPLRGRAGAKHYKQLGRLLHGLWRTILRAMS
jgi:hypothetical protein